MPPLSGYAPRAPAISVAHASAPPVSAPTREALGAAIGDDLSTDAFFDRYGLQLAERVSYDPTEAAGLPTIQHSDLALDDAELERLRANGMVISRRQVFSDFTAGLVRIYHDDLPLYVSADSILYAMHRSYESLLTALEERLLAPALQALLTRMRARLERSDLPSDLRADLALYLGVAEALLQEAPASDPAIASVVESARRHEGAGAIDVFGARQEIDWSQFTPRSHYTRTAALTRYFQASMWLGRTQLRLFEPDGQRLRFSRRAADLAVAMRALMDEGALARWRRIHAVVSSFVGESDAMIPTDVDTLLADEGATDLASFRRAPDDAVQRAIEQRGFGAHRIASQLLVGGIGQTAPQPVTFGVLPQRYTIDSHVLSNVVYDRAGGGAIDRLMPSPLDAAFAALENDLAAELLRPELTRFGYARDLHAMRVLVDGHEEAYWDASLYTLWLGALRTLSPSSALAEGTTEGLPEIAGTDAWNRRLLSAQRASWAELRHNTALYSEQSATAILGCSYPDAYIEPYPAFFHALSRFAARGDEMLRELDGDRDAAPVIDAGRRWLTRFGGIVARLGAMAEKQRRGEAYSAGDLAFINEAVAYRRNMCGGIEGADGWYTDLFYDRSDAFIGAPIIADVHTQPTDAAGNLVGHVLHVATGFPRLMVVSVDACDRPRAYAGVVSSYYEVTTQNFERLNDASWLRRLHTGPREDVEWLDGVLAEGEPRF